MFKFWKIIETFINLCVVWSKGILRFIISISFNNVFLELIIIFLSTVFILCQILRKQNTA